MSSEYDPLFGARDGEESDDLEVVRERFARASRPFLRAPWTWLAWAVLLPAAALATPEVAERWRASGVLLLWSVTILLGGAVEAAAIARAGRSAPRSSLSAWVLRMQGNTSLLAALLSAVLLWVDAGWALPGLWLVLLGHSFYLLGGLALPAFRGYGLLYQGVGALALLPVGWGLECFAVAAFVGNLWMAFSVWRERRDSLST